MNTQVFLLCAAVLLLASARGFAAPARETLFDPQHQFTLSAGPGCADGEPGIALQSATASPRQFAATRTELPAEKMRNTTLQLQATVHVRAVQTGAGLWVGLYDGTQQIALRNTQKDPVRGEDLTRTQTITLWVPPQTTRIVYGVTLQGTGSVTACGLRMEAPALAENRDTSESSLPVRTMHFVLDTVRERALHSAAIDWSTRTPALLDLARHASEDDLYAEMRHLLTDLHDGHSFILPPTRARRLSERPATLPVFTKLSSGIKMISVPDFTSHNPEAMTAFSAAGHTIFAQAPDMRGWIVDLRADRGGNMWAMLGILKPLLGAGELGVFEDRTGQRSRPWRAEIQGSGQVQATGPDLARVPVAVLIGPQTASAGEAVAIALKGRPQTRFFGRATHGQTTGNTTFTLPDGGMLALATEHECDRTGQCYEGPVQPDDVQADPDAALRAAEEWMQKSFPQKLP